MKFHKREFMKACPKCGELHDKVGTFCSRKCANSRVQTEEANAEHNLIQLCPNCHWEFDNGYRNNFIELLHSLNKKF